MFEVVGEVCDFGVEVDVFLFDCFFVVGFFFGADVLFLVLADLI